jgi:hypothetical protein
MLCPPNLTGREHWCLDELIQRIVIEGLGPIKEQ